MVDKQFTDEFNRRLGQFTGNRARRTSPSAYQVNPAARLANTARGQLLFQDLFTKEEPKKKKSQNTSTSSRRSSVSNEPVRGNFTQEDINLLLDSAGWKPEEDKGFFGNIIDTAKSVGSTVLEGADFVLDPITRPARGVSNALYERAKAINEGQNTLEATDETIKGFLSGVIPWKGEKTGLGEVVEEVSKRDELPGAGNDFLGNVLEFATSRPGVGGLQSAFTNVGLNPFKGSSDIDMIERAEWTDEGLRLKREAEQHRETSPATYERLMAQARKIRNTRGADLTANIPLPLKPLVGSRGRKQLAGLGGEVAYDPLTYAGIGIVAKGGSKFAAEGGRVTSKTLKDGFFQETVDLLKKAGIHDRFAKKKSMVDPFRVGVDGKPVLSNLPVGEVELWKIINRAVDDSILEIAGGMRRGRIIGLDVMPYSVSSRIGSGIREFYYKNVNDFVDELVRITHDGGEITPSLSKWKKDPLIGDLIEEELVPLLGKGQVTPNKINDAATDFLGRRDKVIHGIVDELYQSTYKQVYNAPGIRIGSKTYGSFDRLGRAYQTYRAGADVSPTMRALSFNRQMSGRTRLINQRLRSIGHRRYEDFHRGVVDTVKRLKLSKEERKLIHNNIVKGIIPDDPRLQEAQEFIQDAYRKMMREEIEAGVRKSSDISPDNYVYNFYKTNKTSAVDDYRQRARNRLINNPRARFDPDHVDRARELKLRPEEDAFKALLLRKQRSNRLLTKAWLQEDLIDNYGQIATKLADTSRQAAHLRRLPKESLPQTLRQGLKDTQEVYIPKKIGKVYDEYLKLLRGGEGQEVKEFVSWVDAVNRVFKSSATVYWPGFHFRNSLGDMFMSFLDGVTPADYGRTLRFVNNPNSTIDIAGRTFTRDEIIKEFRKSASTGGFYRGDLPQTGVFTRVDPNSANQKLRQLSENREDFFRFTHFLRAFKDEYPKQAANIKNPEKALRNTVEAATYRVNGALFDYNALTNMERKVIKRLIPFYTYNRKVLPALFEAVALNPNILSKTHRSWLDFDGSSFSDLMVPEWQREIGFMRLDPEEEENPWIIGAQFLPTAAFRENTNLSDAQTFFGTAISQLNPILKAPIEIAAGETFFNQRPIESNSTYVQESIPPVRPFLDLFGLGSKEGAERFLAGRIGLGLPVSKVDDGMQTSALYDYRNEFIEKTKEINKRLDEIGYRIAPSFRKEGASFRLRNVDSGVTVFESRDPQEVYEWALRLL